MNNEPNQSSSDKLNHVIPESLLALAKDARYINQCKEYLVDILRHVVPPRRLDQWESPAASVASLLYTVLVVVRKQRSAGMEVCGIDYATKRLLRVKLIASAVVSALWAFAVRRWIESNQDTNTSTVETLTGASRIQVFERQRLAMTERATMEGPSDRPRAFRATGAPTTWDTFVSRLLRSVCQALHAAVTTPWEGPHGTDANVSRPSETHSSTAQRVGVWLVRLHLAAYCIHGRHPSWMHRLMNIAPWRRSGTQSPLVHRPVDTARMVGWMMVLQAAWTLLQALSQPLVHCVADWTVAASHEAVSVPRRIHFDGLPAVPLSSPRTTCLICRQPRQFPACPVTCGHVACWSCLHQWVASHSAACPLCRTPCTTSDIALLHNYDAVPVSTPFVS